MQNVNILAIESSCDDTSAAVLQNNKVLANIIANQQVHESFGGVVPELASRAHQQNIIPVVDQALRKANINKNELHAIAYTGGPGLLGSLLVGSSFAKAFAMSLNIPLILVDHMHAHIMATMIDDPAQKTPPFPFLCLTVSGGHTQISIVRDHFTTEVIGHTLDDAAGEAFDKAAKVMSLPYPGGPVIDKLSQQGNKHAFTFSIPRISGLNFSFSGLKTSFLYFLRDSLKTSPEFIEHNKADLCASYSHAIVNALLEKILAASVQTGIDAIAVAGGVSANSMLRSRLLELEQTHNKQVFIPKFEFCTDNAAMVGIVGYYGYMHKHFSTSKSVPYTRQNSSIFKTL